MMSKDESDDLEILRKLRALSRSIVEAENAVLSGNRDAEEKLENLKKVFSEFAQTLSSQKSDQV